MRAHRSLAALVAMVIVSACARSQSPLSPSNGDRTVRSGSSFGLLVPAGSESISTPDFGACLGRAAVGQCFDAEHMRSTITFAHDPSTLAAPKGGVGAPDTLPAPNPPTNLFVSVYGSGVSLSWRAPASGSTPTGYRIEAGSGPGLSDLASFNTGSTSTYYSATVSGGGTFYVRVEAVGSGGISEPSNEVVVVVSDPRIPLAPCCPTISVNGSSALLTWYGPYSGATPTTYVIQASSTPHGPADLANFATGNSLTSFSASGIPPGTYFIRILAANSAGVGPPSSEVTLVVAGPTPCSVPPSAPTNLVPLVQGSTVTLGWSPSVGLVTSYSIDVGSSSGLADLGSYDTGRTNATVVFSGVPQGTFYVRVRGKNACGTGGASNEVVVTVR